MICNFQSLYFGDDGYIVHCHKCNNYQVAFISTMLTLSECEFASFSEEVKYKCMQNDFSLNKEAKGVIISTPSQCTQVLLTLNEAERLSHILDEADTEEKAQHLLQLFNA